MNDLFDLPYPDSPGWSEPTTSRVAARSVRKRAPKRRNEILGHYRKIWPAGLNTDEVAAALGWSILSTRPRCTELLAMGLLTRTTITRPNAGGGDAWVLCATAPGPGSWS
jgi:hypothetical protein